MRTERRLTTHGQKERDVGLQLSGSTWVTFQVKTAKDATIAFFHFDEDTAQYKRSFEVVIGAGNNTSTGIR